MPSQHIYSGPRVRDTNTFIQKAEFVHGGRYSYTNTSYKNSKTAITIDCPVHGPFEQTPIKHLSGHGCRKCQYTNTKYYEASSLSPKQKSEPAILYHIRIYNDVVSFEKIGHTRKTLEEQFKNLSSAGYHYEVLHIIHTTWYDALLKEELVAEHLKNANLFCRVRELKYTGVGGWTECYPEGEYDPSHLFIRL